MSSEKMSNSLESSEVLDNKEKANNLWKMIDQIMDLAMQCPLLEENNPSSPFGKEFKMGDFNVKIEWMLDDWGRFSKIDLMQDWKVIMKIDTNHSNSSDSLYPNNLTIDLWWKTLHYNWTLEKDNKTDKYRWFFDKGDVYENVYPQSQKYLEQIQEMLSTQSALLNLHNDILQS